MKIFGLAGWSGSGKTTLLLSVLPLLTARGLAVATIKHAHHNFDIDRPGKDSYRHRQAGAGQVMISSSRRWALMRELNGEPEWSLERLLGKLEPSDLVLVEGFKRARHEKLEVHRRKVGGALLYPHDSSIKAVVSDSPQPGAPLPFFALDAADAIAAFIVARCGLG